MKEVNEMDTNVTVEVTGADNLEVTFEDVPGMESDSKGKLNVGAVVVAGVVIGLGIMGIRKAIKYVKARKAAKTAEEYYDDDEDFFEEDFDEQEPEEEPAPEEPKAEEKKNVR